MTALSRNILAASLTVSLAVGLAACHKKVPPPAPAPPPAPVAPVTPPQPPTPPPPPAATPPAPLTEDQLFARKTVDDLNAEKPLSDVFFDLDNSDLKDQARTALQKNAEWLKRWPTTKITVEGHCDSRGTPEYNLGLGERRASAVRDYLVSLGVTGDRVLAVSKGKEAPVCTEENEACWSQNRRGHFVFTAK